MSEFTPKEKWDHIVKCAAELGKALNDGAGEYEVIVEPIRYIGARIHYHVRVVESRSERV